MADTILCRQATVQDLQQVQALWKQCFDDTPSFVQWYFSRYYRAEHTLGIFDDAALLASAQIIPYTIGVRDSRLDCAYIVGVDTAPQARHKGYAKKLLLACLEEQRRRKQPISLLMPFEGQFYYRYGWSFCYFHQRLLLQPQELRCAAREWGTIKQIDLFEAQGQLADIYARFAAPYHGAVIRTKQQWRLLLEDAALENTQCFLLEKDGAAQGYCLWTPLKGKIFIREMAWIQEQAKAGLLWFLQDVMPEQHQLWLELPQDDALVYQLAAVKDAVRLYPFLMARIVDVAQCLEQLSYPMLQAQLILSVSDCFAPWNHHSFLLCLDGGIAKVQIVEAENMPEVHHVAITIEGLSQLVMGTRSAGQLQRQDLLQVENDSALQLLEQLWPPKSTYINEYY